MTLLSRRILLVPRISNSVGFSSFRSGFFLSVLAQLIWLFYQLCLSIVDPSLAPERVRSRLLLDKLSYKIPFFSAPRVLSFCERFPVNVFSWLCYYITQVWSKALVDLLVACLVVPVRAPHTLRTQFITIYLATRQSVPHFMATLFLRTIYVVIAFHSSRFNFTSLNVTNSGGV